MSPVYKFSNVGGFLTKNLYTSALAGNPAVVLDQGSMSPLGVFTLSAAQANVEFANIPQAYTHLQLRINWGYSITNNNTWINTTFNSDTSSNYSTHALRGDGSTAFATASANRTSLSLGSDQLGDINSFAVSVIDILDYRNTNKFKTTRAISGQDRNGAGVIGIWSGSWRSTSAITSIKLFPDSGNFISNSTFALYGVNS